MCKNQKQDQHSHSGQLFCYMRDYQVLVGGGGGVFLVNYYDHSFYSCLLSSTFLPPSCATIGGKYPLQNLSTDIFLILTLSTYFGVRAKRNLNGYM